MAEQQFVFSRPVMLPLSYNNCQWLRSISRGNVASASNERRSLRGREPYIVVFSLRQLAFCVFFNERYGGSQGLEITNEQIFYSDLARNCSDIDIGGGSSPRRKRKPKRKSPKRKSPKRKSPKRRKSTKSPKRRKSPKRK